LLKRLHRHLLSKHLLLLLRHLLPQLSMHLHQLLKLQPENHASSQVGVQVRQVRFLVLQSTRCRQRDLRRRLGQLLLACHQPACLLVVRALLVLDPFRLLRAQCRQLVDPFRLLQVVVLPLVKLALVSVLGLAAHAPVLVALVSVLVLAVVPALAVLVALVQVDLVVLALVAQVDLAAHVLALLLALADPVVLVVLVAHVPAVLVLAVLAQAALVAVLVLVAVPAARVTTVSVVHLERSHVRVAEQSSTNCSRSSLAIQIAMHQCLKAPSSSSVEHRHKSLHRS